jgi:poly(3-hydroxyalkanoate) synthetase
MLNGPWGIKIKAFIRKIILSLVVATIALIGYVQVGLKQNVETLNNKLDSTRQVAEEIKEELEATPSATVEPTQTPTLILNKSIKATVTTKPVVTVAPTK